MKRIIFHIDVNSAFLSWEAAKRVKNGESDIREIASCIGGDPTTRKGVVLAKSNKAKEMGVKTGEPLSFSLRKCPDLQIFKPDFKLYQVCSKAFKNICKLYSPTMEEFSIDECFLDMTGIVNNNHSAINIACEIKNKIKDELGFTVNIGIGENKLCAKIASDFEKPDKVHTLFSCEVPTKMWNLPVRNLLYVGETSAKKLNSLGIYKIGDLAHAKIELLIKYFGNKRSLYMHNFANAIDNSPVISERPEPKGYSNSVTLEENLSSLKDANTILLALSDTVTQHMRKDGNKAHCVSVTIRFPNFKNQSHQTSFSEPLSTTNEVYKAAKKLLEELWKDKKPIRLISISLTNLTKLDSYKQLSFFDKPEENKTLKKSDEKIDKVIDDLRKKYGFNIIKRGGVINLNLEGGRKLNGELDTHASLDF